jgi:hypothetical protein
MEVGEVYGPLKVDEGYSIFKLIGKREPEKETLLPFEESKEKLKAELTQKKLSKFFIDYTVELANKYKINIDEPNFRSLRVNDFKLYTIRHMGFGGRITAVPLTIPFYQWADEWEKSKREMP